MAGENIETFYKYKGQTNELQGISFKIGNYKYKGSEIDRKCSLMHLERILKEQRLEYILQTSLVREKSKRYSQDKHQQKDKYHGHDKNLLKLLLKPEKQHQVMQMPLLIKKHPKKNHRDCIYKNVKL